MRIICTTPDDYKMALALSEVAAAAGIQADVVCRQEAYALTIWSVDDLDCLKDQRVKNMSATEKEEFMEYAQKQLKADMVERGWDSLDILLGEFFDREAPEKTPDCESGQTASADAECHNMGLDEILIKYFGSGFLLPESPSCEAYSSLVSLLYDIGSLASVDMNDIIETLDDICNENALRDENGELIYNEGDIAVELDRREALEETEENQ